MNRAEYIGRTWRAHALIRRLIGYTAFWRGGRISTKPDDSAALRATKGRWPHLDDEFWTCETLAGIRGVKRSSISKEVSEYRRLHGRDPQWVHRFPGKQRGFRIKAKTYMVMMRGGAMVPAGRKG